MVQNVRLHHPCYCYKMVNDFEIKHFQNIDTESLTAKIASGCTLLSKIKYFTSVHNLTTILKRVMHKDVQHRHESLGKE